MMKALAAHVGLCLALVLAGAASAQIPVLPEEPYPDQALVERAEARGSKAASAPCEAELKARHGVGPACTRYHAAVLDALQREHRRFAWCNVRMSETTGVPVPKACFATENGMRIPEVIGLERRWSRPRAGSCFRRPDGEIFELEATSTASGRGRRGAQARVSTVWPGSVAAPPLAATITSAGRTMRPISS